MRHKRYHSSLPPINYNVGSEKRYGKYTMVGAVYKIWCHVCSWNTTAGSVSESRFLQRKHEHIDTEVKRVA